VVFDKMKGVMLIQLSTKELTQPPPQ